MSVLISIIIATYNSEKTLANCLSSIVSQKSDDVELIVIDGASKDNTLGVLEPFKDYLDCVLSEPDNGIYDAWNKGLSRATGAWVMFVGSDDQLREGCIAEYRKQISKNSNYDYISGRIMLVTACGEELREFGRPFEWRVFRKVMNLAHVSALHSRKLYDTYGPYDPSYKICGDYELLLRAGSKLKVKFVDHLFANMAIGGVSSGSFSALSECRRAKLSSGACGYFSAYLRYMLAVSSLLLKKLTGFRG